jgi:hypothetical protein
MAWSCGVVCEGALETEDVWGAIICIKRQVLLWIGNGPFKPSVIPRGLGTLSFCVTVSGSHYIWGLGSFQHATGSVFEKILS